MKRFAATLMRTRREFRTAHLGTHLGEVLWRTWVKWLYDAEAARDMLSEEMP